jgi:hypothetical protein
MRMPNVQFTVRGMMVAVAVIAFDFFVLIMTDGAGVLLIGLLLNVGFVRWWRTQGRHRRYWGGFVAAGLGAVLAYSSCAQMLGSTFFDWPWFILSNTLPYLPLRAAERIEDLYDAPNHLIAIFMITTFESTFGLPMILFALIGGLLSAFTWPPRVRRSDAVRIASAEA